MWTNGDRYRYVDSSTEMGKKKIMVALRKLIEYFLIFVH